MRGKVLCSILVLLLAASFAMATGQTEEAAGKVKLIHINFSQPPYDDLWMRYVDEFQSANPNVEVEFQMYSGGEYTTKIRTAVMSGEGIDTFNIHSTLAFWYIMNDLVVEVDPAALGHGSTAELVDGWYPGAFTVAGSEMNGKIFGLPHENAGWVGWMNKVHMREAGLDPEKGIPATWDEYTDLCLKLAKKESGVFTRNGHAFNYSRSDYVARYIMVMMQQKGHDWVTQQGVIDSLDTEDAKEVFTLFTDWAKEGSGRQIWDIGLVKDARQGFATGMTSTMLNGGSWYWGVIDQFNMPRENALPFAYPRFKDAKNDVGAIAYGSTLMVAKSSKHQTPAWQFLNYLVHQPDDYIQTGWYVPSKRGNPELPKELVPNWELFRVEIEKGSITLPTEHLQEFRDLVQAAASRVIFEDQSVDDSLSKLKADCIALFK